MFFLFPVPILSQLSLTPILRLPTHFFSPPSPCTYFYMLLSSSTLSKNGTSTILSATYSLIYSTFYINMSFTHHSPLYHFMVFCLYPTYFPTSVPFLFSLSNYTLCLLIVTSWHHLLGLTILLSMILTNM